MSVDGPGRELFIPASSLASPRGVPRIVEDWVDQEQLKRQAPRDGRSYDVTTSLLNKNKGKTMTPRRPEIRTTNAVPGPATYRVLAPPLLKPTFNRSKFAPVLPDSPSRRKEPPRFRGAYLSLSPSSRDERPPRTDSGDNDDTEPHLAQAHSPSQSPSHSPTARFPGGHPPSPLKGKHSSPLPSPRRPQPPSQPAASAEADSGVAIPGKPIGAMRDIKIQLTKLRQILAKKTASCP